MYSKVCRKLLQFSMLTKIAPFAGHSPKCSKSPEFFNGKEQVIHSMAVCSVYNGSVVQLHHSLSMAI